MKTILCTIQKSTLEKVDFESYSNSTKLVCKVLLSIMKYYIIKFSFNPVQHNQQATALNYSFYTTLEYLGILKSL